MLKKIRAWIKLTSAPGISSGKAIRAVRELGSPEEYLDRIDTPLSDLSFISATALEFLGKPDDPPDWGNIAGLIEKHEIKFVSIIDKGYPFILKTIPDPPAWLFYLGELKESDFVRSLAVVGTRNPSMYGITQCNKITEELVQQQIVIVSGLAFGIDSVAHNAALRSGGRTIAVLGTGIEQIYPPEHRELSGEIKQKGVLVSEYLPGSKINVWNFPSRNRIISGLSQGTWVVEGGLKSGSLITAKYAREQQRPVFTLPGDINRKSALGANHLLQEGAFAVLKSSDILNVLGISLSESPGQSLKIEELNEFEKKVYQILLSQGEETDYDKLLILSKLTVGELSTIVLSLELKGYAKKAAGNRIYPIK